MLSILSRYFRPLELKRLWLFFGILLVIAITTGSLLPLQRLSVSLPVWDKLQHFAAYTLLVLWFGMVFVPQRIWHLLVLLACGLGLSIEIAQAFTPDRIFEWGDIAANTLGALCGLAVSLSPLGNVLDWFDRRLMSVSRLLQNSI